MGKMTFDLVGIPEFFANTVELESAGDGMVRAIYCTQHNGVYLPVCRRVRPSINILKVAPGAIEFCRRIMMEQSRFH